MEFPEDMEIQSKLSPPGWIEWNGIISKLGDMKLCRRGFEGWYRMENRDWLESPRVFPKSMKRVLIQHAGNCLKNYLVAMKCFAYGFNLSRLGINQ